MEENENVLYPSEIEPYLESLQIFNLSEIGNPRWYQQQERIYKLSLQAAIEAKSGGEELVKDETVLNQKVPVLIHELIAVELWRLKVFPRLLQQDSVLKSAIPLYIVLYHEVTIMSFLETLLFHEDVVESIYDLLVDLVDHCYRKIMTFKGLTIKDQPESTDEKQRLLHLRDEMNFESGIKSISILSCIAQHKKLIPLAALHRLLEVHDVPLLFTDFIYQPPWVRQLDGQTEKYADGHWKKVTYGELMKMNKIEGQIWMSLIQLLLDPECQNKYNMTDFRKDQILRLRPKLSDVIVCQIPLLGEVRRYLEHLSLFDAPIPKKGILIEQVPEIWESMRDAFKNKWGQIAEKQAKEHFSLSEEQLQELCRRLSGSFDMKHLEAMLPEGPKCANCHETGEKRCSRCRNEWYCGRTCQVTHWTKHKPACDLMTVETEALQQFEK